ncbi:MAG: hypothetical protein ACRDN0_03135 [Trebonia sp.]
MSDSDQINLDIRKILEVTTAEWGVEVTLVELKDIRLTGRRGPRTRRREPGPRPLHRPLTSWRRYE